MEPIEQFVDRLMQEKGFANLEADVLHQIKSDLMARVEDRVNAAIVDAMPENRGDEFEQVLDTNDVGAIQRFCAEVIPDLNDIVARELVGFRQTYLGLS